jgi:hypothetical protein
MRVFRPSTIPHPWRETLALFAVVVWVMVAEHWLIMGPLLWLLRAMGPIDWNPGGMSA